MKYKLEIIARIIIGFGILSLLYTYGWLTVGWSNADYCYHKIDTAKTCQTTHYWTYMFN